LWLRPTHGDVEARSLTVYWCPRPL